MSIGELTFLSHLFVGALETKVLRFGIDGALLWGVMGEGVKSKELDLK